MKYNIYVFFLLVLLGCDYKEKKESKKDFLISEKHLIIINSKIVNFLKDTILNSEAFVPERGIYEVDSVFTTPFENKSYNLIVDKYISEIKKFDSLYESLNKNKYLYKGYNQRENDSILLYSQYENVLNSGSFVVRGVSDFKREFLGLKVKYQYQLKVDKKNVDYFTCVFIVDDNYNVLKFNDDVGFYDFDSKLFIKEIEKEIFEKNVECVSHFLLLK